MRRTGILVAAGIALAALGGCGGEQETEAETEEGQREGEGEED